LCETTPSGSRSGSAAGRGFAVTAPVGRWWDRAGADLDLVAVDDTARTLRVGTCKRSADKLPGDRRAFEGSAGRLLARRAVGRLAG